LENFIFAKQDLEPIKQHSISQVVLHLSGDCGVTLLPRCQRENQLPPIIPGLTVIYLLSLQRNSYSESGLRVLGDTLKKECSGTAEKPTRVWCPY